MNKLLIFNLKRNHLLETLGLGIGVVYVSTLAILLLFGGKEGRGFITAASSSSISGGQGVVMEDLNRIEYREGVKKWTMLAKSAQFKESTGAALLKEPIINVFQKDSLKPTQITSKAARIRTEDGNVKTALLEGDVRMITPSDVVVESEIAEYSSEEAKVFVPDTAKISGEGYWVQGRNLVVFTESNILEFGNDVESSFEINGNFEKLPNLTKLSDSKSK